MAKINYYLKRPVEKTCQVMARALVRAITNQVADVKIYGKENLPRESAIIAPNHCVGLDGFVLGAFFPRQVHFWIQAQRVYNSAKPLFWSFGEMPLKVPEKRGDPLTREQITSHIEAAERSCDYLKYSSDFIGIFPEGPTNWLRNGCQEVISLEKREHFPSAAHVAVKSGKPIVPVYIATCEDIGEELWEMEGQWRKKVGYAWGYSRVHGKIPYDISIGKPIRPQDVPGKIGEKKEKLVELVKNEIIRLSRQQYQ